MLVDHRQLYLHISATMMKMANCMIMILIGIVQIIDAATDIPGRNVGKIHAGVRLQKKMIRLQIKYSSSTYSWLCFRHAVQEAMRSEDVKSEIGDWYPASHSGQLMCDLCKMEVNDADNARAKWYENYVGSLERLGFKQPTEEELREEATKVRSKRKR